MKLSIVFLIIALAIYATDAGSTCTASDPYCGAEVKAYDITGIADGGTLEKYPKDGGCGTSTDRTRLRDIDANTNAVTTSATGESYQAPPGVVIDMTPKVYCDGNVLLSPSQSNYDGKYLYATAMRYDGAAVASKKEIAESDEIQNDAVDFIDIATRNTPGAYLLGSKYATKAWTYTGNAVRIKGEVRDNYRVDHTVGVIYHFSNASSMTINRLEACKQLLGLTTGISNKNGTLTVKVRTSSQNNTAWNTTKSKFYDPNFSTLSCTYRDNVITNYSGPTSGSYFDKQTVGGKAWYYYANAGVSNINITHSNCSWVTSKSCSGNADCAGKYCAQTFTGTDNGTETRSCNVGKTTNDSYIRTCDFTYTCPTQYSSWSGCNVNCTGKCGTQSGTKTRTNLCTNATESASCSVTCPTQYSSWSCSAICLPTNCGTKNGTLIRTNLCTGVTEYGASCSVNCSGGCGTGYLGGGGVLPGGYATAGYLAAGKRDIQ
jgi:hypothetical protein